MISTNGTFKLIAMLFLFSVLVECQELSTMIIKGKAEFLKNEFVGQSIRDKNREVCAAIIIETDLTDFGFDAYNGLVKTDEKHGRYVLYISPNERQIEIFHSGFIPLKIFLSEHGIDLQPGQVWKITVTGDARKNIELVTINILPKPDSVKIFIDEIQKESGRNISVTKGKHVVRCVKPGYSSITDTITVTQINTIFDQYKLTPISKKYFTISSRPSGARIFLNEIEQDSTDRQIYDFPGTYRLRLLKQDYVAFEDRIDVTETGTNEFVYTLVKNLGAVHFVISQIDASITVSNETGAVRSVKEGIFELPPGKYNVEISKKGYLPIRDSITITRGGNIKKTLSLTANAGYLVIEASPPKAIILIDDKNHTGSSTITLAPNQYRVDILAEGYTAQSDIVDIVLGKTVRKIYRLEPIVGSLAFTIRQFAAQIKLVINGTMVDSWKGGANKKLQIGDYVLTCSLQNYRTVHRKFSITKDQETVIDVNMEPGQDYIDRLDGYRILKSAIIPGWGQFSTPATTEGVLFLAGTVASVGATLYLANDYSKKLLIYQDIQKEYLAAQNTADAVRLRGDMNAAYETSNNAYKTKNIAVYTAAGVYIANLANVLLFHLYERTYITGTGIGYNIAPSIDQNGKNYGLSFTVRF